MTAFEELQTGDLGEGFVELVGRTIRAVAISRNFPPFDEHETWTSDAVATATSSFFASPQTPRRLADLRSTCSDEDGLRLRLQATIRNFLADVGRKTEVGRLVLRINDVLADESGFVRNEAGWSLTAGPTEPAAINFDDLVATANHITVVVPTAWRKSTKRKSPEVDRESVVRLCSALIDRAGGSVRASNLAQVIAVRLGVGQTPLTVDTTAFDPPAGDPSDDSLADAVLAEMRASEVFGLLNDAERVALGRLDLSVRKLGDLLGVSKSQAAIVRNRAESLLIAELCDEDNGQEVASIVLSLVKDWVAAWTPGSGTT